MTGSAILLASSGALGGGIYPKGVFAGWLHWTRGWHEDDVKTVRQLVRNGCRFLFATGLDPVNDVDLVDDAVIGEVNELVLTSIGTGITDENVLEFFSTRCPSGDPEFRLIAVLGNNPYTEFIGLREICNQIKSQWGLPVV